MESPHSDDDSSMEELLHQLEVESVLELKLDSFRRGSGSFVTKDQGNSTNALSADVEKRYENLKARSFSSGAPKAEVAERVAPKSDNEEPKGLPHGTLQAGKEEPKGSTHDSGSLAQCVGSFRKDAGFNDVKGEPEPLLKSSTEPLSEPKTQQTEAAKKNFRRSSPSPSPPATAAAKQNFRRRSPSPSPPATAAAKQNFRRSSPSPSPPARCSCFCISSREAKSKQRSGNRWAASKGGGRGTGGRGQGKAGAFDQVKGEDEEWAQVLQELEGMEGERVKEEEGIDASLFDVEKNEKELKRVSMNEKHLTHEAHKFVDWVASSSARFTLSPDHVDNYPSSKRS